MKVFRDNWHSPPTSGLLHPRVELELDRRVLVTCESSSGIENEPLELRQTEAHHETLSKGAKEPGTEAKEVVDEDHLYTPKFSFEQVVLPREQKSLLLETVSNYEKFRTYREKANLDKKMAHDQGLVLLLCGPCGTGKTMTVNAIASHLNKKVLLVDLQSLPRKTADEDEVKLRSLFREAKASNAILFFDECETICKHREIAGDRTLSVFLTEIQRYEGIVFLATNRPFDLDEAMHRRISSVFEFKMPDHIQRKQIWKVLLSDLNVAKDINWDLISLKYELSGGFIKNAIMAALIKATSRDTENPVITEKDIIAGCAQQMRGSLQMKTFSHRVIPSFGFDKLIVDPSIKKKLDEIISFEKARNVVYGQWGFEFGESKGKQKGVTALLWGPKGIGKTIAAKAIGFEVGRPLKLVHFSQLQYDTMAESRKAINAVFKDARLMDAVLVLDGFESFHDSEIDSAKMAQLEQLLGMMNSFPGIVILLAHIPNSMSSSMIQSDFCRQIKFVVEMSVPRTTLRGELWKTMFPSTAPLSADIDFKLLGERFELSNESISNAVYRAATTAAMRESSEQIINMKDLMEAAEIEKQKSRGVDSIMFDRLFV